MGEFKKLLKEVESTPGVVDDKIINEIKKINVKLTSSEADLVLLKMYKKTKDIHNLQYESLLAILGANLLEVEEESKKTPTPSIKPEEHKETEDNELETVKKDVKVEDVRAEDTKLEEDLYEAEFDDERKVETAKEQSVNENNEYENITEEEMINISQKAFYRLAETMRMAKVTARQLYHNNIIKQRFNGEDIEIIETNDFINGIQSLGIEDFQVLEYGCLIKVLALDENEEYIKLSDLILILEDYGIHEEETNNEEQAELTNKEKLDLRKLDSISMIVLMELTESLINADTPLYPLFGKAIQKVTVDEKSIELINAKDFFDTLANIGLVVEEGIHEPLVDALGLPQIKSAISVDKLKSAIEQFATDEALRKQAQEHYEELMNKGALEEDGGHGTINERHDEQDEYYSFLIF